MMSVRAISVARGLALVVMGLAVHGAWADDAGAALYATHCQACHQAGGEGAPGIAPPLNGTLAKRAATPDGLGQLASTLAFGLTGPISSRGERYNGNMPPFANVLSDADLAALLGYVLAQWNGVPTAPDAALMASARQKPPKPGELRQWRERLLAQLGE